MSDRVQQNELDRLFVEAVRKDNIEEVKEFLGQGADKEKADVYGWTPLHVAAMKGHFQIVKYLVEQGADKEKVTNDWPFWQFCGTTPLHAAIIENHLQIVEYLLEQGSDVNCIDKYGNTTLHSAVVNNNIEMTKLLFMWGVELDHVNQQNEKPIDIAIRRDYKDLIDAINKEEHHRRHPPFKRAIKPEDEQRAEINDQACKRSRVEENDDEDEEN
jgi:ankyrin repeat protein